MKQGKGRFIKGAVIIATGGFIAKLIGALYRIPLTNLIGGRGIGLYQLVYPVYCLLLTVSATGIPSSIAKLVAERAGTDTRPLFKSAMRLFLLIGFFGSLLMALTAPVLSRAQSAESVKAGYYALAPSVFLVSGISVFRGYFQGKNKMTPTALSEIIEQAVKVGFGLLFAYLHRGNIEKAVVFLLLSVSISELVALLFMMFLYNRHKKGERGKGVKAEPEKGLKGRILRLSIPVTFTSLLIPLSALVDSVVAVRLLSAYSQDAVTLYGLFAGGAITVINLPVSVCYGVAVASVPAVASALDKKTRRKKTLFALGVTLALAVPSALVLYLFPSAIVGAIYRNLQPTQAQTLIGLIKTLSPSALFLSGVQTLSACLTARGKPKLSALSMLVGVIVKTTAYCLLLQKQEISVFGLAHATNLCYLVAFLLDLLYNFIDSKKRKEKSNDNGNRVGSRQG